VTYNIHTVTKWGSKKPTKKNNQDPKINYQIFGNRTMAIQNGKRERKKYGKLNKGN